MNEPILTVEQVAQMLRCTPATVRVLAKDGKIPAAKIGKAWLFVETDLVAHIRSQYKAPEECSTDARAVVISGADSRSVVARLDAQLARQSAAKPKRSNSVLAVLPGGRSSSENG